MPKRYVEVKKTQVDMVTIKKYQVLISIPKIVCNVKGVAIYLASSCLPMHFSGTYISSCYLGLENYYLVQIYDYLKNPLMPFLSKRP